MMTVEKKLLQEVRDDVKALREEVQELKTEIAIHKAYLRVVNWVSFTVLPAIGAGLTYLGFKVGVGPH
jgi:hypothetical protein